MDAACSGDGVEDVSDIERTVVVAVQDDEENVSLVLAVEVDAEEDVCR